MNLANKLTLFRVILVPIFVAVLMIPQIPCNITIALAIFIIASITDFFDGHIARTRNMVTNLGKFLDPIADKVLIMSALVCFVELGWIRSWIVIVILAREFVVSGVRMIAVESEQKIVIPARMSGKIKTAVTMLVICAIMILWALYADYGLIKGYNVEIAVNSTATFEPSVLLANISNVSMIVCAVLTVFSGVQYVWDARKLFKQ